MCCFSGEVSKVSNTEIFARASEGNRQILADAMSAELNSELAIILPLPVPQGSPEDCIRFIDLSSCPDFFPKVRAQFDIIKDKPMSGVKSEPSHTLTVQEVGVYEASFIPCLEDFDRLDSRFRLPSTL